MSRIHKIAVFISHIYGDYQANLCQGVIDRATEYGYHVDIFNSNDEEILGKYSKGESSILKIPNPNTYDGVITSSGTFYVQELRQKVIETLQKWDCPIIDINSNSSPFPKIFLDNNTPIADLVSHLASFHKLNKISFIGNSQEKEISGAREHYYTKAMLNMGLSSFINIAQADYSPIGVRRALDTVLESKPEAIVCYNDDMAFTVMEELALRGYSIPKDIAVTGCDNLEFGQNISPSLTTITFPTYELGEAAFQMLLAKMDGTTTSDNVTVKASPRFGGSCGCAACNTNHPILFKNKLKKKIDTLESIYLKDIHMSSSLQGVIDMDDAMDALTIFLENIEEEQGIVGLRESYLCLYSDWEQISTQVRRLTQLEETPERDKMILKLALREHVRLAECTFSRNDCLPEFLRNNGSQVYVYTALYFGDKSFGYLCQAYKNNKISYPFSFVSWLQTVDSMLQSISDNRNMQLMVDRLEEIYSHDSLTGLLNLQSFNMLTPAFLKRAESLNSGLISIVLDLDHLKFINDKYGHAEGNFAIQVLGQAISQMCNDDLLACRFGGDEFYILATNMTGEEAQKTIFRVQSYLENYNENNKKTYRISVSGGYTSVTAYTEDALQDAFKIADQNMYRQKELRHAAMKDQ